MTLWWHQPFSVEWSAGAVADRKRQERLIKKASSVLCCPLEAVEVVGDSRIVAKLSSMMDDSSHPMQDTLSALNSSFSDRLLHPRCVTERDTAGLSCLLLSDSTISTAPSRPHGQNTHTKTDKTYTKSCDSAKHTHQD